MQTVCRGNINIAPIKPSTWRINSSHSAPKCLGKPCTHNACSIQTLEATPTVTELWPVVHVVRCCSWSACDGEWTLIGLGARAVSMEGMACHWRRRAWPGAAGIMMPKSQRGRLRTTHQPPPPGPIAAPASLLAPHNHRPQHHQPPPPDPIVALASPPAPRTQSPLHHSYPASAAAARPNRCPRLPPRPAQPKPSQNHSPRDSPRSEPTVDFTTHSTPL